jgi:hypothetical protein
MLHKLLSEQQEVTPVKMIRFMVRKQEAGVRKRNPKS